MLKVRRPEVVHHVVVVKWPSLLIEGHPVKLVHVLRHHLTVVLLQHGLPHHDIMMQLLLLQMMLMIHGLLPKIIIPLFCVEALGIFGLF